MMVRGHIIIHRRGGDGRLRVGGRAPPRREEGGLLPLLLLIVIAHVFVAAIVLWFHIMCR
jgi:hypothetical protein